MLIKFTPIKYVKLRSSRSEVFCKRGALKNFTKLTGKHLCQNLFYRAPPVAASENSIKSFPP